MSSHGVLKNGRPYDQEYLHILRFNKDNKVVSDDEVSPSLYLLPDASRLVWSPTVMSDPALTSFGRSQWVDSACAVQAFAGMVMPAMGPDGRITNVEEAKRANSVKAE